MYNDRQPLDCLNLSVKYVSHWTYLQGLRQLYQNFMDACVEKYPQYKLLNRSDTPDKVTFHQAKRTSGHLDKKQDNFITYDKKKKILILQNQKSFPIKCLLMGCSQKGPEALGQFGEGMKVSMIVLLKANLNIIIESGQYIYYPTIKSWDHNQIFVNKYEHQVLYVKVKSKKFSDKTKVTVENVDQAKFDEFLYLSLALLDESKYEKIVCGESTLIFPNDPKLIGKVYKKGVRLELYQSANSQKFAHYSYDLNTIQVGRQRDCVNNVWDLYKLQSQLHYNVMCKYLDTNFINNNPHLRPLLRDHIQIIYTYLTQNNYQTHFFHSYSPANKSICDLIYQEFLKLHNNPNQLYPQYDSVKVTVLQNLILYGLPNTFYPVQDVSWEAWHTLRHSTRYKTINKKIEQQILNKQIKDLTTDQTNKMNTIRQKISTILPQISQFTFKVKLFKNLVCCKDKDMNIKVIYLNPEQIKNADKMTRNLCKMLLL